MARRWAGGSGKTEIGRRLAEVLKWTFLDADDFHPPANVRKMRSGTPLTDADRWPWLDDLAAALRNATAGVIRKRMEQRAGHFMPTALLDSQLALLERPTVDERPIVVDVAREPEAIVRLIVAEID